MRPAFPAAHSQQSRGKSKAGCVSLFSKCAFTTLYLPAQLVNTIIFPQQPSGQAGSSPVSLLLARGTCLHFPREYYLSFPFFQLLLLVEFSLNFANLRSRAFRGSFFFARKSLTSTTMHSQGFGPASMTLLGTSFAYCSACIIRSQGLCIRNTLLSDAKSFLFCAQLVRR